MLAEERNTVASKTTDDTEKAAENLRERLLRMRRLRYCQGADREDVAHDAIVRLLEQAKDENVPFTALLDDGTGLRRRKEAARSAYRRRRDRDSQSVDFEESECPVADQEALDQVHRNELIERVERHVRLSEREQLFFHLWYGEGLHDTSHLAYRIGIDTKGVHRLKHKIIHKLKQVPRLLMEAEEYNEHESTYKSESGPAAMR
jgi:DNA-directed RNA polymerase specialized sigma24 family protein